MKTYDPRNSNPTTQNDLVWGHLKAHKTITQGQALQLFGVARLAARIGELRGKGHDIKSEMIMVNTRSGKARIARYIRG